MSEVSRINQGPAVPFFFVDKEAEADASRKLPYNSPAVTGCEI